MKRSPLQVEDYLLRELSFKVNEEYNSEKPEDTSGEIQYMMEARRHIEDPNKWQYILGIRSKPDELGNHPYFFTVILEGYFAIDPAFSDEKGREKLINANAPALLYTVAREILSSTSAHARWGRINLPTVYFPPTPSPQKPKKVSVKKTGSAKKRATRSTDR